MGPSPKWRAAEGFCACLMFFAAYASAQDLFPVTFGQVEGRAFIVDGGGEAVSVGISGVDLSAARLGTEKVKPSAIDKVSRIVVFPTRSGDSLQLADSVQPGQSLSADGSTLTVECWVEQVRGRYLPFSLLRIKHAGPAPVAGSPLLDRGGKVAAVVYESAGRGKIYAIPVDVIRRGLSAARNGAMTRAWVGVVLDPNQLEPRVVRVVEGSPASTAGLKKGDLLVEVDGRKISDYGDAVNAFFLLRVGKDVSFSYSRDNETVATTRLRPTKPR